MDPLGSLIDWIVHCGLLGLFAVGLVERFIPALPSYGGLLGIGITAVDGAWSFATAVIATTCGSFCGGLALYLLARAVDQAASRRLLYRAGKVLGLSAMRVDKTLSSFRARERALIFILN